MNHVQRKGTALQSPRSIFERCDDCGAPAGTTCTEWNTGVRLKRRPTEGSGPSEPTTEIGGWGMSSTGTPLDEDLRDLCSHVDAELDRVRDILGRPGAAPDLDDALDRWEEIRCWAEAAIEELEARGALASAPDPDDGATVGGQSS